MTTATQPLISLCSEILLEAKQCQTALENAPDVFRAGGLETVQRATQTIFEHGPFADFIEEMLHEAICALNQALEEETEGYTRFFDGIHDPDEGDIGRVVSRRVLTPRGKEIERYLSRLEALRTDCRSLAAQVFAARYVQRALGHGDCQA